MSKFSHRIVDGFGSVHGVPELPAGFLDVFESYEIRAGAVNLHSVIGGKGPPLLLLAGWPQNWYAWRDVMLPLAQSYEVIAADPRGFGLSEKPDGPYDTGTIANDLVQMMRALGHERFAMVGHDCGMWVGYAMAADHPDRVERIALGEAIIPGVADSPPLFPDDRPTSDFLWHNNFCRARGINEEMVLGREEIFFDYQFTKIATPNPLKPEVRNFFIQLLKRDRRALRASFEIYRAIDRDIPDNRERMKVRLQIPVLGFAGALACGSAVEDQLRRVASNLTCHVIPDCGHFVPEEKPAELLHLLEPFLAPYLEARASEASAFVDPSSHGR